MTDRANTRLIRRDGLRRDRNTVLSNNSNNMCAQESTRIGTAVKPIEADVGTDRSIRKWQQGRARKETGGTRKIEQSEERDSEGGNRGTK